MRPANGWRRLGAKVLDLFSVLVFQVAGKAISGSPTVGLICWFVGLVLLEQVGSPGKQWLKLKCVDATSGGAPRLWQSLARNLVFLPAVLSSELRVLGVAAPIPRAAGGLGLLVLGLELKWMLQRKDQRRLGDAMGDTRVVQL